MKKNRVLIIIVVVILAIIGSVAAVLISRYIKYKPIMGTYELVDGNRDTPLVLNLYKIQNIFEGFDLNKYSIINKKFVVSLPAKNEAE